MTVKLYMSSVSSNLELKKHVQKIQLTLEGLGINYENIDLGQCQSSGFLSPFG